MNERYVKFIKWAEENKWEFIKKDEYSLKLNDEILVRYKEIPEEYIEFLKVAKHLVSSSEKTWFICEDEYNNNSDIAFKWNEFELLSLEAALDDEEWKIEITSWWDKRLPIVMSVADGYSFYAIDLSNSKFNIVKGYEPEFEEVEVVADSIREFFELIIMNEINLD